MNNKMNVNEKDFTVIKMLGKGKGGYSFLVTDGIRQYVLKQIHHEPCSYYEFGNKLESELNDYKKLVNLGVKIPKMIDVDNVNERILKEYIEGDSIFDCVLKDAMKENYFTQIYEMCAALYHPDTNIDYFPTNFIVQHGELFYIDYECNKYSDEWNFENWGIKYWSKTKEFIDYVNGNIKKQV